MKKILFAFLFYAIFTKASSQQVFNAIVPVETPAVTGPNPSYTPPAAGSLSQPNLSTLLIKKYNSWPAAAIPALERVRFIWENAISSSTYIEADMYWGGVAGTAIATSRPKELFANYSFSYTSPYPNIWYPAGIANSSAYVDISPGVADMEITFNANVNWYFGLDGHPQPGQYDFITVALKKLLHGFALLSSVRGVGGQPVCSYGNAPNNFLTAYDNLLKNTSNISMNSFSSTPSAAFTTWATNSLFWSSTYPTNNAYIANSNTALTMYTPSSFLNTVSINNIDEAIYANGGSSLLSPVIHEQEAIHTLDGLAAGMVQDIQHYNQGINQCLGDYIRISGIPLPTPPTTQLTTGSTYNYAPKFHDETGTTCGGGYNNVIAFSWRLEIFGTDGNVYTVKTAAISLFTITNLALPVLPAGVDYLRNYDNSIRGFVKLKVTENTGALLFDTRQVAIHVPCSPAVTITGPYGTPLTESSTWIKSLGTTTIVSTASVKLDANPVNGYIEIKPGLSDFFLSAPQASGLFIAQPLDGCGAGVPMLIRPPDVTPPIKRIIQQ